MKFYFTGFIVGISAAESCIILYPFKSCFSMFRLALRFSFVLESSYFFPMKMGKIVGKPIADGWLLTNFDFALQISNAGFFLLLCSFVVHIHCGRNICVPHNLLYHF